MTLEEFIQAAATATIIPVSSELIADTLTPVSAYLRIRGNQTHSFLFESVEGTEQLARYSIIGTDPYLTLRSRKGETTIASGDRTASSTENYFDILRGCLRRYRQADPPLLRTTFTGGFVGYIGYDLIRQIESIPDRVSDPLGVDDALLELFTTFVIFDHARHRLLLVANAILEPGSDPAPAYHAARMRLSRLEEELSQPLPRSVPFRAFDKQPGAETDPAEFRESVRKAQRYIHEGDIFQVVLSQRFSTEFEGDPFAVYRALRIVNPSPYLYFIDFGDRTIIGSSPEVLVKKMRDRCEVYPIAGTRRRGATEDEDKALERELLTDEKELAEHIMLVDLGRNDLGRISVPGTVRVDDAMFIVRYSHVMHIASRVSGTVDRAHDCVDVFRATFPAGTVSGAPKIRAMEIIDELEKTRRGLYAGGIGYIDFAGNMDMCIAIRTILTSGNRLYFQVGAGIVADSDPEKELQETINKSRALVEALTLAERFAT
jgi:anthranilate synthase component 1